MTTETRASVSALLSELRRRNVRLRVAGERLRVSAPPGAMSGELQRELRARKEEILDFLRRLDSSKRQGTPLVAVPRDGALPLSPAQERMWLLHGLMTRPETYNTPVALRLEGTLDVAALDRSLRSIVQRHEALRTTFPEVDGIPVQRISPRAELALRRLDLQGLAAERRAAAETRALGQEVEQAFDLGRGPLLRFLLLRRAPSSHLLLCNFHHIVTDGWSLDVFFRELQAFYGKWTLGRPPSLPRLRVQYADYAVWQRRFLAGDEAARQMSYWQRQLAGAPPVVELPTDRPRPATFSNRGTSYFFRLPGAAMPRLLRLGQESEATSFMVLLAVFAALLGRLTGQREVVVGSPVANRHRHSEIEELIGVFVNTLVLRLSLTDAATGTPTFRRFLAAVRRVALAAYVHQDAQFERLVEALQTERNLSHAPLLQVLFSVRKPLAEPHLPGLSARFEPVASPGARLDLSLVLEESAAGLTGEAEHSRDLFDPTTVRRMVGWLGNLMAAVATNPDLPLAAYSLLGAGERQQLLVEWNHHADERTRGGLAAARTLHRALAVWARTTPDALALASGETRLSHGELGRRSNRLAHHLRRLGVRPETLVAVAAERGVGMVVAYLGVLKAGGAYVPLDPTLPAARLSYIVEHTGTPTVVTSGTVDATPATRSLRRVSLEADGPAIGRESAAQPVDSVAEDNLAYVIYTSGSTGTPKGVAISHRSLLNLVAWHQQRYAVTPGDRATQVAGLGFDATVWEIWPYLAAGASVTVVDEDQRLLPEGVRDWLVASGATVSFLPTPLAERLLELPWPRTAALRHLLTGGDRLTRYAPPGLTFTLENHYGPTECTVVATVDRVAEADASGWNPAIGRGIANTRIYVLDSGQRPLPTGIYGELAIAGTGAARGYLARPGETAASFVPDPFAKRAGGRLYRTGDVVRWRRDGRIDFSGRHDFQVKIRGFRIELGEIETLLQQHEGVREAVATVQEESSGQPWLAAFVVPAAGAAAPAAEELRSFLQHRVPEYMVPATFITQAELPLTPNGKVDRRALPALSEQRQEAAADFVAPRNEIEMALAGIWREVLALDRLGVHDNFFSLRGNSLQAAQVMARVRELWGLESPLRQLFRSPTLGELAQSIEQSLQETGGAAPAVEKIAQSSAEDWLDGMGDLFSDDEIGELLAPDD